MRNLPFQLCVFFHFVVFSGFAQQALTIENAVGIALSNNYNIRIAQNNALINQTNNTLGNAGFLPEISLNFGQNFNINNTKQEFFSGDLRQGSNVNTSNLNANIQLAWTVFDGFRMFVNQDRLQEIETIGQLNVRFQMETTVARVMSMYYMLEQQEKRIQTIREAISYSQERLTLAKTKLDIGTASSLPLLQAKVDINADSAMLTNQILALKNMQIQLNQLMAVDPATEFTFLPSPDSDAFDYPALSASAAERNNLLQLTDKEIRLAELNIQQWNANKYPTIDINTGYNFNRLQAEIGILKFNQNAGVSFGLTGRWNIFNGWNNKREIQVAKLGLETTKLSKEMALLEMKAGLLTTYNEYLTAVKMIRMETQNVDIARENLVISTEKLKVGTLPGIEIRQAQMNLIEAEFRKIAASFDAKMAALELKRLSGILLK
jgi:outer membrane protein TolC